MARAPPHASAIATAKARRAILIERDAQRAGMDAFLTFLISLEQPILRQRSAVCPANRLFGDPSAHGLSLAICRPCPGKPAVGSNSSWRKDTASNQGHRLGSERDAARRDRVGE